MDSTDSTPERSVTSSPGYKLSLRMLARGMNPSRSTIPPWSSSAASNRSSPGTPSGGEQTPSLPSLSELFDSQLAAEYMPTHAVVKGIGHIGAPPPAYSQSNPSPGLGVPTSSLTGSRNVNFPSLPSWSEDEPSTMQDRGPKPISYPGPYLGSYLGSSSKLASYDHRSYSDFCSSYGSGSYSSWAQVNRAFRKGYSRRQKMAIGGMASLYGVPLAAAAFHHWDALRVASGVASMGTGTAVIPLQQVEGVPERAWIWTLGAWGMCFLPYLWLKTWEIPDQLSYRRKFYIFSVILSSVHFIIGMSQGLEGTGSGFALYGSIVLTTCAYLVAFLFVPREASIGGIVSLGLEAIAVPPVGNAERASGTAGH